MRHLKSLALLITLLVTLIACETDHTAETFLLPDNFRGFFYIVYNQTNGQSKLFEKSGQVYKIPPTGILFTKFKKDWGSIRVESETIDQQFYFISQSGRRESIRVLDTGDFNFDACETSFPKKENFSRDSAAVFFLSAGTMSDGGTSFTTDQYFIGTYNDLTKAKDFTFQYIDSLRMCLSKSGGQQRFASFQSHE